MSKSSSLPVDSFGPFDLNDAQSQVAPGTPAWKQEVNERLAAHRTRRGGPQDERNVRTEGTRTASSRAAEAAARVAARYAKAPSYSQLLAGEARAVVRAAGAAAEAARNAQAAAEAVLAGLEAGQIASGQTGLWDAEPEQAPRLNPYVSGEPLAPVTHIPEPRWHDEPPAALEPVMQSPVRVQESWTGAQPRWDEALPVTTPAPAAGRDVWSEMRVHPVSEPAGDFGGDADEGHLFHYDAFDSHDPVGSATVDPVQHLPANLIEFPRELVAAKKARPRLAEGPLYSGAEESPQLNIFEVDPEQLAPPIYLSSAAMDSSDVVAPPEWASIELDDLDPQGRLGHAEPFDYPDQAYSDHAYGHAGQSSAGYAGAAPVAAVAKEEVAVPLAVVQEVVRRAPAAPKVIERDAVELLVAPVSDRLLAGVVDGALVMLAFLAAAVVVIAATAHPPSGRIALIASGFGLSLFGLLYQFLFLSYAEEGTPGMRYARIALCTFDDDNPSRAQMRQRIPASLLSALPAGLGLLWATFDKEHLGWHDRMTRTYQRKY